MITYVIIGFFETIRLLIIGIAITLTINILFVKDFRTLLKQIKKVAFCHKLRKATLIKNIIYNYFFED